MINKKAIIVCRVSSKEQENTGYSLDAQENLLKEYASNTYMIVDKVYKISESASGKQVRKKFNEIMKYVGRHRVNVILCEKIDRLTRNMKDASVINDWVHKGEEREVHFVKENFIVSKNTRAHENLVWDMKVAVARFYANNLSEEVLKGQKEKITQGWLPSKPPFGYKTIGKSGHKIHVIDKEVAPLIKEMLNLYASGNHSILSLREKIYDLGLRSSTGKKISTSMIHRYLQNPFYCGYIKWKSELYPGKHEPLISKNTYSKIQSILTGKQISKYYTKHNYLFKGKIICDGCGGLVTWEKQRGHMYGHCNNHFKPVKCPKKTYIREQYVTDEIIKIFEKIAPKNEEMLEWIKGTVREQNKEVIKFRQIEIKRLNKLLQDLQEKKDKYFEAKIDRIADADFCDRKIRKYKEEEFAIESALENVKYNSDYYQELNVVIHEIAFNAKNIFEKATIEEKRMLLSELFSNITQDGYKIRAKYSLATEYLIKWMPKLNEEFEHQNSLISPIQNEDLVKLHSWMLAWRNDIRTYLGHKAFPRPRETLELFRQLLLLV